jgi:hypothetical protein
MTLNETTTDWDLTLNIPTYLDRHTCIVSRYSIWYPHSSRREDWWVQYSAKDVAAARLSLLRLTHGGLCHWYLHLNNASRFTIYAKIHKNERVHHNIIRSKQQSLFVNNPHVFTNTKQPPLFRPNWLPVDSGTNGCGYSSLVKKSSTFCKKR